MARLSVTYLGNHDREVTTYRRNGMIADYFLYTVHSKTKTELTSKIKHGDLGFFL